jgi:hypothetical protein
MNPFLPIGEYVPDGEPHVFGDRVYLYGSHDKEAGDTFCMLPYVIWSAPINDLTNWTNRGINYCAEQDPLYSKEGPYMFAPDCVQGDDGRFYLYYCLAGKGGAGGYLGPISVAVCDEPDGKFSFYGHVKNQDGKIFNQVVTFDPAVINDNGTVRLYFGTGYPFENYPWISQVLGIRQWQMKAFHRTWKEVSGRGENNITGAFHVRLAEDMLTISSKPVHILPTRTKGTEWEKHSFFEGSSIRKIGELYYFIYSSVNNHELCYGISKYPDHDFHFGGVLVSNGDVGFEGRKPKDRLNHTGNNHGSMEQINGRWYVFYHRPTHGTDFSRQACAEPIDILSDGTIPQVEITSQGLKGEPLTADGIYSAIICCNLTNGHMPYGSQKEKEFPLITSENEERFIKNMTADTKAVYKYFDLRKERLLTVIARGEGSLLIDGDSVKIKSDEWKPYTVTVVGSRNTALTLKVEDGKIDVKELMFS